MFFMIIVFRHIYLANVFHMLNFMEKVALMERKELKECTYDKGEIVIYQPDELLKVDVLVSDETVWLTQEQIALLFSVGRPAITKHIRNIYDSGELEENGTCSILEHMGNDGLQKYSTKYYNLDVILSVRYRVNSINAIRNEDMSQEMEENVPKNGEMSQETQKNVIRNEISEEELIVDLTELSKTNLQKRHRRQQGIFNLIKQNPYITIDKMAEYLNVNARTIHRDMEELKNLIEHIGPTKGGYWKIKD